MKNTLNINFDKLAISFSAICAIHCLALPIVLIFFPALAATFIGSEEFHSQLLYLIIPSSIIALALGCKMHGKYYVYFYGALGIGVLLFASIFGHDYLGESGEVIFTLLGASMVSYGHYKNQKLCSDNCN